MPAITQLRPGVPISRQRFTSFASKYGGKAPDFMRGSLSITLYGEGELRITPCVAGDLAVQCVMAGKVEVN